VVFLSGARCKLFAYGPADATAVPKPHHLLPHLNPDWFTFLVPAYRGCPGKEAVKRMLFLTPNQQCQSTEGKTFV